MSLGSFYSGVASERSLEPDCNPFCLPVGTQGNPAVFVCVVIMQSTMCPYSILYTNIIKYASYTNIDRALLACHDAATSKRYHHFQL